MKMIAIQTVKAGGKCIAPGVEFDIDNRDEAKGLIAAGAAREKGKADETDVVVIVAEPNTVPRGPASGATAAPSTAAVARAAR